MITNVFSGGHLDRAAALRRDPARMADWLDRPETRLLPVWRGQSLIRVAPIGPRAAWLARSAADALLVAAEKPIFLGLHHDLAYFACDLAALSEEAMPPLGDDVNWQDLRQIGALLPRPDAALLAYARAMTYWHRAHRFCGRCGGPTDSVAGGHVRQCRDSSCGGEQFPRTDPAVIMLVHCGDSCLLGRQEIWPTGMMSTLAGFVEPGETPEEAVAREVMEETGVKVAAIRYHSAQPWPFPGSLMIGFTAEAPERTAPVVDRLELERAAWFTRDEVRGFGSNGLLLPGMQSIARRLIDDWLAKG